VSDLEDLTRLMEADRWIEKVRAQGDNLPESQELETLEHELNQLAERLRSLEAERGPTRDAFNEAADQAATLRARRDELEARLASASAPARELSAMHHELENLNSRLSTAEDVEVGLLLELEPMDEAADAIRASAQPLVRRRRELQEAIRELTSSLVEERTSLLAQRGEIAARVSAPLRKRYEEAMARAGISGAACVDADRCDGCRIALSPLDRDRFRSLPDGEFLNCSSCGRILITC